MELDWEAQAVPLPTPIQKDSVLIAAGIGINFIYSFVACLNSSTYNTEQNLKLRGDCCVRRPFQSTVIQLFVRIIDSVI